MRTVRKFVASVAFLAIAAVVVMFALSNRGEVPVSLWPLPFSISLRLSVALLGALAVGILLGGAISWASGAGRRQRRRSHASRAPTTNASPTASQGEVTATERLPVVADRD